VLQPLVSSIIVAEMRLAGLSLSSPRPRFRFRHRHGSPALFPPMCPQPRLRGLAQSPPVGKPKSPPSLQISASPRWEDSPSATASCLARVPRKPSPAVRAASSRFQGKDSVKQRRPVSALRRLADLVVERLADFDELGGALAGQETFARLRQRMKAAPPASSAHVSGSGTAEIFKLKAVASFAADKL
jgi:hypothetical protein